MASGATEHARPLQRFACDGNSYTEDEFAEWYISGSPLGETVASIAIGGDDGHKEQLRAAASPAAAGLKESARKARRRNMKWIARPGRIKKNVAR